MSKSLLSARGSHILDYNILVLGKIHDASSRVHGLLVAKQTQISHCGRTTPYWLAATQVEADGSCPVRHDGPFHCQKQPLVPCSTTIKPDL